MGVEEIAGAELVQSAGGLSAFAPKIEEVREEYFSAGPHLHGWVTQGVNITHGLGRKGGNLLIFASLG